MMTGCPRAKLSPSISPEFDAILQKGVAKKREDRYQNGKEMFEAMRRLMGERPAPRPEKIQETKPKPKETPTRVSTPSPSAAGQPKVQATPNEPSVYDESSSLTTSSESEINDIFRDLTHTHRSYRNAGEEVKIKTWQIVTGLVAAAGIIGAIAWFLVKG